MRHRSFGRRSFLRGLGLGAGLLPFVPLLDLHAETEAPPRRLVFFYNSNGTIRESWLPTMNGSELVLSPILAPLEAHKSRLLVIDGIDHTAVTEKGYSCCCHEGGIVTSLTGTAAYRVDENEPEKTLALGPSVDQVVANAIGADTKLRSVECGVQVDDFSATLGALSYTGAFQPIMPDNSPYSVFERLFGGFTPPGSSVSPEVQARLLDRKSVLDRVAKDLEIVRARLPQSDRIKLEAHLDGVHALEKSLTTGIGVAASDLCAVPEVGTPMELWWNEDIPALGKLQMDLLVMALACDLTRVGTTQYGRGGAEHRFSWLGSEFDTDPDNGAGDGTTGIHALAHNDANPASREKLTKIHAWFASQLAHFLDRLAAIPEGAGSMLDNTVVVWINELGTGGEHSALQIPYVIAGNSRGFFKTGQLVSFQSQPHNRLLISLCHAMGLGEVTTFGDEDYCAAGALTGLTA